MRDLDLATLQPPAAYAGLWTDYARDTAYGDYTLSPGASGPEATTLARYQPGAWERQGDALRVHHGDPIGSSRVMTGASAQPARRAVYTAFGERVLADGGHGGPPAASRDGYAGAWGYETGLDDGGEPDRPPLPFIHVGERWYDPATGRFLQRDPIGIRGGANVYAYTGNDPTDATDPLGLATFTDRVQEGAAVGAVVGTGVGAVAGATGVSMVTGGVGGLAGAGIGGNLGFAAGGVIGSICGAGYWFAEKYVLPVVDWGMSPPTTLPPPPPFVGPPVPPGYRPPPPQPRPLPQWYCFPAGTLIRTEAGLIPIEDLGAGTVLQSSCPETRISGYSRVLALRTGNSTRLTRVRLAHEGLDCTPEHPFWVDGEGWRPASELTAGKMLMDASGRLVPVVGIERVSLVEPCSVYTLSTSEHHTYFVGRCEILVHNKPP